MSLEPEETLKQKHEKRVVIFQGFIEMSAIRIDIEKILGTAIFCAGINHGKLRDVLKLEIGRIIKNYHDTILKRKEFVEHIQDAFYSHYADLDSGETMMPEEFGDCFRDVIDEILPDELAED